MIFRRRSKNKPNAETVACELIRQSDLFDAAWYLDRYPDVAEAQFDPVLHYVRHGASEGRDPGPWFDAVRYIEATTLEYEGQNPLLHYIKHRGATLAKVASKGQREYSNFSDFLKYSVTNPVIFAPFREEDRRCFAVMDSIGEYLARLAPTDESVKVSIIMPVRDRRLCLQSAIDSVLAQRYGNFELLIIDDASNDGTLAIAENASISDSRIKVIHFDEHVGVCAARNAGLNAATGDIIAYLDSDNTWLGDYLGAAIGAFTQLPSADAIYGGQYIYAEEDIAKLSAVRFGAMNFSLLEQHNYIDLNCFLHRRTVIDSGFYFDENLQRLVDWDFVLRISDHFRIVSVPVLLSRYFLHVSENTITKTIALQPEADKINSRRSAGIGSPVLKTLSRKVCVVIPSYQALAFLQDCVASLQPYLHDDLVEVVIVDNHSSIEVKSYLESLISNKIKVIFNSVNYGFSYAVNQGVSMSSPDADVLILNNDANLGSHSLEIMQQVAYESSDTAIAVPQQILPSGAPDINVHVPYATAGLSCDVNLSYHHRNIDRIETFHDGRRVELNFAPFFCVYIKRAIWDLCGGLDFESGRHYRSDRIMCDFVRHILKGRIVYVPAARVYHAAQAATRALEESVDPRGESEYRTMFTNNAWPIELMKELKIRKRPWQV